MSVVNWTTGNIRALNKKSFYVISSCNGETNFDSLAFLPEHHGLLKAFVRDGIVEFCRERDPIDSFQYYRKADNPCLIGIDWCVTGLCNLHCRHCYMESPSGRYGETSFENTIKIIEEFERANVIQVSLTGGEPFMRKDILEIIGLLAEKNILLSQIYSNGLLISEEHLYEIKMHGFLPTFQISFDGVGTHDQMRGLEGIEQNVIDAIQMILRVGFPVAVATSIDQLNAASMSQTYCLMKNLGVNQWRVARPQRMGNWKESTTGISTKDAALIFERILSQWLKDNKPFSIDLAGFYTEERPVSNNSDLTPPHSGLQSKYTFDDYDCFSCREHVNLLPDGRLIPCPGYVGSPFEGSMPNIFHEGLSKAWSCSFLREIIDMKKKDLLSQNPECEKCVFFSQCGMGCRASALLETGNVKSKDPVTCDLWKGGYKEKFLQMSPQ